MTEKEEYEDVHNKKHLTINNGDFVYGNDPVGIEFVLENGDELKELTKKAQQQSAELNKTLEHINHFVPRYRLK